MKNIIFISIFCIYISCISSTSSEQNSNDLLVKILEKTPNSDLQKFNYSFEDDVSEKMEISPLEFKAIYQIDSLLKKFNQDNEHSYLLGKQIFTEYSSLIILRYYGEWIRTIETLNYNNKGEIIGFMFNASDGGSDDYYFGKGNYNSDSTFIFERVVSEYELNSCDSLKIEYIIKEQGQIEERSRITKKFECEE